MEDLLDGPIEPDDDGDDEVAERLVESARRLLTEGGLDQVTMRSVAIGAGVSTMNVYSRFGGKDGLLDVLYREGFEALGAEVADVDEPDLARQIRAFAATYRRFALEHPARYELMFGGESRGFRPSDESSAVARKVLSTIAARIDAASERGEIELPVGADAVHVAAVLWAMCHGALVFETGSVADSVVDWSVVSAAGVDALIDRYCHQRT
ncbi:MAG TPA: TetR/AcrR family transcriptional regulator [Ilumatobacter sp.]|nr:TetR/AcrR family transcriptional regulator [Ilumatobacter sp.]